MPRDNIQMGEKPWPCVKEGCNRNLGYIIRGEFTPDADVKSNTSGVQTVYVCPQCGTPKVWYPKKPTVVASFLSALAEETTAWVVHALAPYFEAINQRLDALEARRK